MPMGLIKLILYATYLNYVNNLQPLTIVGLIKAIPMHLNEV